MYRPKKNNVDKMNVYYEQLKKQGLLGEDEVVQGGDGASNNKGKCTK